MQWGQSTGTVPTSPALPWGFVHQWNQILTAHPNWILSWKQQFELTDIPIFQVGFSSLLPCLPVLTQGPIADERENNSDICTQAEGNAKLMQEPALCKLLQNANFSVPLLIP